MQSTPDACPNRFIVQSWGITCQQNGYFALLFIFPTLIAPISIFFVTITITGKRVDVDIMQHSWPPGFNLMYSHAQSGHGLSGTTRLHMHYCSPLILVYPNTWPQYQPSTDAKTTIPYIPNASSLKACAKSNLESFPAILNGFSHGTCCHITFYRPCITHHSLVFFKKQADNSIVSTMPFLIL